MDDESLRRRIAAREAPLQRLAADFAAFDTAVAQRDKIRASRTQT